MINKIGYENFKSFSKLENFELKPITVICGTNSCGKSSIIQSIMALKQTIESQSNNQMLLLNGKYVHLGLFENIIYEKKSTNEITLKYEFDMNNSDKHNLRRLSRVFDNFEDIDFSKSKILFEIKLKSLRRNQKKILKPIRVLFHKIVISHYSKSEKIYKYESSITLTHNKSDKYNVVWNNIEIRHLSDDEKLINGTALINFRFSQLLPIMSSSTHRHIDMFYWYFSDILKKELNRYSYIGPLREEASRRYIYENEITEIGLKGQNAPYLYLSEAEDKITYYSYNKETNEFGKKLSSLKMAVNDWLTLLGINGFDSELTNEVIHLNLKANEFSNIDVNIADVGFGISQVFPIILEGLRIKEYQTLVLEQPEIHLHPKMQMDIADYFLSLAKNKKNLLIETHSEHLINRFVRRILEDDTNEINKLINIYFVSPSNEGAKIEKINIDPLRGIKNWPTEFFDQSAIEQEKILLAGLNKRKRARESIAK